MYGIDIVRVRFVDARGARRADRRLMQARVREESGGWVWVEGGGWCSYEAIGKRTTCSGVPG